MCIHVVSVVFYFSCFDPNICLKRERSSLRQPRGLCIIFTLHITRTFDVLVSRNLKLSRKEVVFELLPPPEKSVVLQGGSLCRSADSCKPLINEPPPCKGLNIRIYVFGTEARFWGLGVRSGPEATSFLLRLLFAAFSWHAAYSLYCKFHLPHEEVTPHPPNIETRHSLISSIHKMLEDVTMGDFYNRGWRVLKLRDRELPVRYSVDSKCITRQQVKALASRSMCGAI